MGNRIHVHGFEIPFKDCEHLFDYLVMNVTRVAAKDWRHSCFCGLNHDDFL